LTLPFEEDYCSGVSEPPPHHFVNVGPHGTFRRSGSAHTSPADVDETIKRIRDKGSRTVVLHFHGGLVDEAAGLRIASRILAVYENAGAYGITIVWETGLIETVARNLDRINSTRLFNQVVNYAIRHVAMRIGVHAADGAKGPGTPMTLVEVEAAREADEELTPIPPGARGRGQVTAADELPGVAAEIEAELELELAADPELGPALMADQPTDLVDPGTLTALEEPGAKGVVSTIAVARLITGVAVRSLRRFIAHRDHGVIPTVVEEALRAIYLADLGAWAWAGMKRAADEMFEPNDGSAGEDSHAGSYVLAALAGLQRERPELKIDLVGHSAGSIAIANLLGTAAYRHPELSLRNVLLLAPAATTDVFAAGILDHEPSFSALRIFTMKDALETRDRLVCGVYPRSLLYFISGVLEPPEQDATLVGLARHTRGRPPYDSPALMRIHEYLAGEDRLVLSKSPVGAADGLQSAATRHGDFDDDPSTLASLAAIVGA
jgi:hypothetical protein